MSQKLNLLISAVALFVTSVQHPSFVHAFRIAAAFKFLSPVYSMLPMSFVMDKIFKQATIDSVDNLFKPEVDV